MKEYILLLILVLATFSLGWIANQAYLKPQVEIVERPVPFSIFNLGGNYEIASPSDRIKEEQIHVYDDGIYLDIQNATWSTFVNTNSMDPFLDSGSNGIEIQPVDEDDVNVGDVISYRYEGDLVVHRVVEKGVDEEGVYFKLKGDNNNAQDPGKVRFEQVHGVLVGIIY